MYNLKINNALKINYVDASKIKVKYSCQEISLKIKYNILVVLFYT